MAAEIQDYPSTIKTRFRELFTQDPIIIGSPGRINLIGEHTDYNMGFVMPAAIDKAIYLGIQKREDDEIHLHSLDYDDEHITTTDKIVRSGKLWPDYLLGVVDEITIYLQGAEGNRIHRMDRIHRMLDAEEDEKRMLEGETNDNTGEEFRGFNVVFGGDIPPGAGLSSSAALECATAFGLNELFGLGLEKMDMVKIAQAAENNFVGMKCGIMDQFASMFGKKDHLIRLDCQSLEHQYIPFQLEGVTVVLFDTRVKHSLASSAYNERREECEMGVALVNGGLKSEVGGRKSEIGGRRSDAGRLEGQVGNLRDVSEEMLLEFVKPVNEVVYQRCSFVVAENKRLLAGCKDLENNDVAAFGKKMFETHKGLSELYEVSCKELDLLVDIVKDDPNVLGARMMGGGFGGCTINLIKHEAVADLIVKVSEAYKKETGVEMLVYKVLVEDGTGIDIGLAPLNPSVKKGTY
ncbi:MAG: galactokinase [Daejeonella sp.]|uniref:galactokinase n=1 Tax=Daejeonella sp. TaxID=2805397 RepID=UPI003C718E5B